jgi:phosphoglycolate phosphatase-like HAD superfamily hydrolase
VHHGLLGVAALWGFGSRDELESAGATLYLDSPVDLHQL